MIIVPNERYTFGRYLEPGTLVGSHVLIGHRGDRMVFARTPLSPMNFARMVVGWTRWKAWMIRRSWKV